MIYHYHPVSKISTKNFIKNDLKIINHDLHSSTMEKYLEISPDEQSSEYYYSIVS